MNESLLLLDAGNTRLKWAFLTKGRLRDHGSHAYSGDPDGGVADALGQVFAQSRPDAPATRGAHPARTGTRASQSGAASMPPPARAMIGSVAPNAINDAVAGWLEQRGIEPRFAEVRVLPTLTPAYDIPSTLGVDRWLAMLGARSLYPGPVCVADCGTALTLDSVDQNGGHLGGMIVPGFELMQQSLLTRTARIDQADQELPRSFFGATTGEAVNAGATCSLAATLDRFVLETSVALSVQPVVIVTGGGRERLLRFARCDAIEVPDLVLLGLASLSDCDA